MTEPASQRSFGSYQILEEIGRGAQGTVFLAEDARLGRRVALKVMPSHRALSDKLLARFRREAELASRLDHPAICTVFEAGVHDGEPFFAMQWIDGESLAEVIASARDASTNSSSIGISLPGDGSSRETGSETATATKSSATPPNKRQIDRVLLFVEQTARALHEAHEANLIHRDIKPGNIMVTRAGSPVILDFGLARETTAEESAVTMTGDLVGTPAYMAPEQLLSGRVPVDRRADVYALATTLFECLTLRLPFEAPTRDELFQLVLTHRPPDPRKLNPHITRDLQIVIDTALEKDCNRRYQSAIDFAEDLRRVRTRESIRAKPIGAVTHLLRWTQRHPGVTVALIALVLTLATGLAASMTYYAKAVEATSAEQKAKVEAQENLAAFGRVASILRLRKMRAREAKLYPATPTLVPAMTSWLEEEARPMLATLPERERELAEMRARSIPPDAATLAIDRSAHPDAKRLQLERNRRAEIELDAKMVREKRGEVGITAIAKRELNRHKSNITKFSARIEKHRVYRFQDPSDQFLHDTLDTLVEELRAFGAKDGPLKRVEERLKWARSVREETVEKHRALWQETIAQVAKSSKYDGLELRPQTGLIPLGVDEHSQLHEFAHLRSGEVPTRDDKGRLRFDGKSSIVFVLIPAGTFQMGASADAGSPNMDSGAREDEGPVHEVTLDAYFLAKHEMSQGQWLRLTGKNPSNYRAGHRPGITLAHPVESISWFETNIVLGRLGLTLPTEAQWERAMRADTMTVWPFGDTRRSLRRALNIADSSCVAVGAPWAVRRAEWPDLNDGYVLHAPVLSLRPNPFGLHHMLGNVSELCRDRKGPYQHRPVEPGDGARRTWLSDRRCVRGGTYADRLRNSRSAARYAVLPNRPVAVMGVRPARAIQ